MPPFDYRKGHTPSSSTDMAGWLSERPQIPYILPFLLFLLVMLPESFRQLGGIDWDALWKNSTPLLYAVKSLVAAAALWYLWPYYTRIRWGKIHLGVLAGLLGTPLWIASELACQKIGLVRAYGPTDFYNPDQMLPENLSRWIFLCVRVAGPALVVPFMEELFFRDFVMRAFIKGARFQDIPVGTFTWASFLGMSFLFGINHGWTFFIPGVLYGFLMGILLIRTKSLGACIVAHGITNWTLYLYVIYTGDWQFM